MRESELRAIDVVGLGPHSDTYGVSNILVFAEGNCLISDIDYVFDGSKLEFKTKPKTDVVIYTFATSGNVVSGSFRIIRHNLVECTIPSTQVEAVDITKDPIKSVVPSESKKQKVDKSKTWRTYEGSEVEVSSNNKEIK